MRASSQRTAIAVETGRALSLFCYPVLSECGRPACIIAGLPKGSDCRINLLSHSPHLPSFPLWIL